MPITFTTIRTINLVLDFLEERLAAGDTVQFITKMTSLQQELEAFGAAVNDTAQDINTVTAEIEGYEIDSAYDIAVERGFVGSVDQYLASLVGADGVDGIDGVDGLNGLDGVDGLNGLNGLDGLDGLQGPAGPAGPSGGVQGGTGPVGLPGDGFYAAPIYSQLDQPTIDALVPGDRVQLDDGRIVQLADDAIRNSLGTVDDVAGLAVLNPQYGDYAKVTADGGQYHYYDGAAWVDTGSTSLPVVPANASVSPNAPSYAFLGAVADTTARDALTPANGDYVTVTADGNDYHYWDAAASGGAGGWVDTDSGAVPVYPTPITYLGEVADTTARDALSPSHGDYASVTADSDQYHYFDKTLASGAGAWVDTGSTEIPRVVGIREGGPQSTFQAVSQLPSVSTFSDLDTLGFGSYPEGVLVEDTGEIAYRDGSASLTYQDIEGTAAAFGSGADVAGAAQAGQALRVQIEVTADTHARVLLDAGGGVSMGLEITATGMQPRDSGATVGVGHAMRTGDIVGLYRLANGDTRINVNGRDAYQFARLDTSALSIAATLADTGDWLRFAASGTDGQPLRPIAWDAGASAAITENTIEGAAWSTLPPGVEGAIADADGGTTGTRIVYRQSGQAPITGSALNKYPDGATVVTGGLVDTNVITIIIKPGESAVVGGVTYSADAAYNFIEPVSFGVVNGGFQRIGGNVFVI